MLNSLPAALIVGTALGFLSGLGIGGGSLLIVWLTAVLQTDPMTARSINLLFFIPSAIVACTLRMKRGELHIKPMLPAILSGCAAAAVLSRFATMTDTALLKKLFGAILIAAGIRELLFRPKGNGSSA